MPPKQTRQQKDAAAEKRAQQRAAKRDAQTAEETRAHLDRLAEQQRILRAARTPSSRDHRDRELLYNASSNRS